MKFFWTLASLLTCNLVRSRGPTGAVYLSFDDGPHPVHTPPLLDLLARHDVRASFYLTGFLAEAEPALVARMLAEGHVIGNHSMTHPRMLRLGLRAQWAEIDRTEATLARLGAAGRHGFRPPYGRVTWAVLAATLLRRQPLVLWSIDSLDYTLGPAEVVQRLRKRPPKSGDIILFHDDADCARQALAQLLPEWKRAGLRFGPLR